MNNSTIFTEKDGHKLKHIHTHGFNLFAFLTICTLVVTPLVIESLKDNLLVIVITYATVIFVLAFVFFKYIKFIEKNSLESDIQIDGNEIIVNSKNKLRFNIDKLLNSEGCKWNLYTYSESFEIISKYTEYTKDGEHVKSGIVLNIWDWDTAKEIANYIQSLQYIVPKINDSPYND